MSAPASSPLIGHGSKLTIVGPTGGTALNKDLACLSIDPGSNKIDTSDVTDMLTAGTSRIFLAGLEDGGDVTVKWNFNPVDLAQAAFVAAKGLMYDFKIATKSGGYTWTFSGIVTSVDTNIPDDKPITQTGKIKISGAVTGAASA